MSLARILNDLRRILDELEDELDVKPEEAAAPRPKSKPRRRAKTHPAPLRPVSDVDRMRAVKMLRRMGIT